MAKPTNFTAKADTSFNFGANAKRAGSFRGGRSKPGVKPKSGKSSAFRRGGGGS